MKFLPVGAELFHEDGQTDMTKLIDAFRYFANAATDWNTKRRSVPLSIFPPQIPYGLFWNWNSESMARGWQLTAWVSHGTAVLFFRICFLTLAFLWFGILKAGNLKPAVPHSVAQCGLGICYQPFDRIYCLGTKVNLYHVPWRHVLEHTIVK
jgi:hypothetical protein